MRPGRPQRWSHDYYRHGTTSLFAALDVATGRVIAAIKSRHRSREFVSFLRQIEREVPSDCDVHLILDNYATHKTPEVAHWLKARTGWHLHFIPTHLSWLNQVERFFAQITTGRIRRRCFRSVAHLRQAIEDYLAHHNANPRPFRIDPADSVQLRFKSHGRLGQRARESNYEAQYETFPLLCG
jgi:transposase